MIDSEIDGLRPLHFMEKLNYIRAAGTEGERKAAEVIASAAKRYAAVSVEPFTFEGTKVEWEELEVTAPYQEKIPVSMYRNCGNTPGEGVTAPFLYAENGDDISLSDVAGKIVMINGPLQEHQYRLLLQNQAAGFLSICGSPADPMELRQTADRTLRPSIQAHSKEKPGEDCFQKNIPGATIHYHDAVKLISQGAESVRLAVCQSETVIHSQNVEVVIPGRSQSERSEDRRLENSSLEEKASESKDAGNKSPEDMSAEGRIAEEILTLTAHYDSVPQGPGAYDNLAGAAIILELCRYFSLHRPRRTLRFIWFGAEERGLKGSIAYVKRHEKELEKHRFHMNVDLAGQAIGGNVLGITGTEETASWCKDCLTQAGIGCEVKRQVWSSDSNTFAWKGIPAMTLNRDGFGMHTCQDTLDRISPWSLQRSTRLLGCLAETLANAEAFPFERKVPAEMKEELGKYFIEKK